MESGNYIIQLLDKEIIDSEKSSIFEREYLTSAFHITVADKDRFTYLFDRIRITNIGNLPKLKFEELKRRALNLCEKVTYLVEDLDLIELDSHVGVALLRSKLVQKNHESVITYFELTLNQEREITVGRFRHNKQTKVSESQTFNLTAELAERFLNHLDETIA